MKNIRVKKAEIFQNGISTSIAIFMLCILPMIINDGYLDINTIKVTTVIQFMPWLVGAYLIMCVLNQRWPYNRIQERKTQFVFLGFLLLTWCLSAAHAGFSQTVLWGNNGRYAGLYFLFYCAMGCFCIASGKCSELWIQIAFLFSGTLIAILGFLNVLGLDPLGAYTDLLEEQRLSFLSTIGNINFYGCGLLFSLSMAAAMWVNGRHKIIGLCCSIIIGLGICCSITDTALIGLICSGPILLYMVWGDAKAMQRALIYSAGCVILIPATQQILLYYSKLYIEFPGLFAFMTNWFIWLPLSLLLVVACLSIKFIKLPERPKIWVLLILFLFIGLIILGMGIKIGRLNYNGEPLGEGENAELDIFDLWGKRGFIYYACLRCYHDFSWDQKMFGCGIDRIRPVIEPYLYYDGNRVFKPDDYVNDAHCQPLHYLLTCGILGCVAYSGFYACTLIAMCWKRKKTVVSNGILLSLFLYLPSFLLNVAQPIMLIMFFGAAGLGISCIKERNEEVG